jgi:putative transcriptional regulator
MNLLGNLLIAPPAVKNNFWTKTVILVTEHAPQGSLGLVLNKSSEMSVVAFGNQLGFELDYPGYVYVGGPVSPKNLSFLHSSEWSSTNTLRINERFSISSDHDIIPRMAQGDCPEHWRIFLGLCGWAPGQLDGEVNGIDPWKQESSWCIARPDTELVFGSDNKDQWCNALDRSGLEFAQRMLA